MIGVSLHPTPPMTSSPRILAFGGSLRQDSFNHQLASIAARGARGAGAQVTLIRLRDYPLPLFDEDLEKAKGMPEPAAKLKKLFADHDGLLIASPEYNGGISAALKNVIDWVSRASEEGEPPLSVLKGKTAAILAGSPGTGGGRRGLEMLRTQLEHIRIEVLKEQVSVSKVHELIDGDGELTDPGQRQAVAGIGEMLAKRLG